MATIKSIEERAKAYDEALEAVKNLREGNPSDEGIQNWVNENFPELAESKDEKIRKDIIGYLALYKDAIGEEYESWIAWLEKQVEHANFRNKIQIGDKVTRNKDGVLVNLSQLKRVAKKDEKQAEQKPLGFNIGDKITVNGQICKVVAVEQKPAWGEEDEINLGKAIWYVENPAPMVAKNAMLVEWLKNLRGRVQPQHKQKWSEEDKRKISRIYSILGQAADTHAFSTTCRLIGDIECIELQDFIKSLRPQPKQELSERDEKMVEMIINDIRTVKERTYCKSVCDDEIKWLKSLRPQSHWKPSDEQMKALNYVVNLMASSESPAENDYYYNVFKNLREQLKKLREE